MSHVATQPPGGSRTLGPPHSPLGTMTLRLLAPLLALCFFGGCIVHRDVHHGHGSRPSKSKKSKGNSKQCHPSQYWDGDECRHKGKGKGARKHDG